MAKSCNKNHRATQSRMQQTQQDAAERAACNREQDAARTEHHAAHTVLHRACEKERQDTRKKERKRKTKIQTVRFAESRWRLDKRMESFRIATWRLPLSLAACSCISRRSATIVSCAAASRCTSRLLSSSFIEPYSVWQCVAGCCSVVRCGAVCWQCVGGVLAVCCNVLQCVAARVSCPRPPCCVLQCVAVCCSVLQCVAVCCSVLECWQRVGSVFIVCCSVLQCVAARVSCPRLPTSPAVCCRALQCAAICCSPLEQYVVAH